MYYKILKTHYGLYKLQLWINNIDKWEQINRLESKIYASWHE